MPMNNRLLRPTTGLDPDAAKYLAAVEAADGEPLEPAVRTAINAFFAALKATPGLFDAIKASCILCGARTITGALVPLAGDAPTSNGFVSGDYSRTAGLTGDGTSYIDSGRNSNADPQNDYHSATWVSTADGGSTGAMYLGAGGPGIAGSTNIGATTDLPSANTIFRSRSSSSDIISGSASSTGLLALSRSESVAFSYKSGDLSGSKTRTSETPVNANCFVFSRNISGSASLTTNATLAFYSIGTSLSLEDLGTAVSNLITAIGEAI